MLEKVKRFFDLGLYDRTEVLKFAEKGIITEKECLEILKGNNDAQRNG